MENHLCSTNYPTGFYQKLALSMAALICQTWPKGTVHCRWIKQAKQTNYMFLVEKDQCIPMMFQPQIDTLP